ncbi:MAG: TonB-dependent receptor, partial [Woeseia sp.]
TFKRKPLARAISAALTGSVLVSAAASPAMAQDDGKILEEITVTAQKRTENLQDVAVSVQVLGNTQLEQLNINGFEDYIEFLPTVSYTSNGPGYGILYMRGISSGGDGVHSGSMPSVGVYLDEQPVTTINQVLDVHIYDVARIETLAGPQGTLYGQGSQAGTLRIITNKPNLEEFQSSYDLGVDTVKSGDTGYTLEGMLNIPIHDKAAVRLVGWHEYTGGYIDNVPGTITYAASGITVDNSALVEKDFNDVETTGARALLKIDLNDNWTFTPGLMYQQQEAHGLWAHDPEDSGDLEVVRFFPDDQDEDWLQAMSTIEGNVLDDRLNIVYAVSTLDRNVDSLYDYTGYAEYLEDVYAYYGYACYQYAALGGCADPSQYVDGKERFTRLSHELRVQSNGDGAFRWVAGLFSQKQVHDFDLQWIVPELDPAISVIQNGHTVWQTYQVRTDRDEAIFGEVSFDVTDKMSLTLGGRHFKYDNRLYGYNGGVFWCTGFYDANGRFVLDDNGTPQYPCFDTRILDDSTKGSGNSWKGTVNYHINDDVMVYATYSEGFRAGGVNRARLEQLPKYRPDWVNNHEFGWKTTLLDGRM